MYTNWSMILIAVITTRKRSLGQGNMFTGMCLSTGAVGGAWSRGVHGPGGVGAWYRGVCMVPGGAWSRGEGVHGPGGCMVETPPTATAEGGTHPTGMHSCFLG